MNFWAYLYASQALKNTLFNILAEFEYFIKEGSWNGESQAVKKKKKSRWYKTAAEMESKWGEKMTCFGVVQK